MTNILDENGGVGWGGVYFTDCSDSEITRQRTNNAMPAGLKALRKRTSSPKPQAAHIPQR